MNKCLRLIALLLACTILPGCFTGCAPADPDDTDSQPGDTTPVIEIPDFVMPTEGVTPEVARIYEQYGDSDQKYLQLAKLAIDDQLGNWWEGDTQTGRLAATHSGRKTDKADVLWEAAMTLYGVYDMWVITGDDLYKDYLVCEATRYKNDYVDYPTHLENPAGRPGPASDDCAWSSMLYLIFYEVTGDMWWVERSANLCDNVEERWYDEELGGLCYSDQKDWMSLYETGIALSWFRVWEITGEQRYYDQALNSYTRLHNASVHEDGIYVCEVTREGHVGNGPEGSGEEWHIEEANSCSFLAGNMAMAVLAAKFYEVTGDQTYLDRVYAVNDGLIKWYNKDGVLLNDRDAWTNGTYASYYVSQVLSLPDTEDMQKLILNTADSIMTRARTEDGRYGGSWQGPAVGNNSIWFRNASIPQQAHTSACSISMVTAAAMLEAGIDDFTR